MPFKRTRNVNCRVALVENLIIHLLNDLEHGMVGTQEKKKSNNNGYLIEESIFCWKNVFTCN